MGCLSPEIFLNKYAFQEDVYRLSYGEGGVHPLEGGCMQGCIWRGASRGGCILDAPSHPVNRMTHACENITLPHTPYAVGKDDSILYRMAVLVLTGTFDTPMCH